jgi:hypothetical protein
VTWGPLETNHLQLPWFALDLYSGGFWLENWLGYRLQWLTETDKSVTNIRITKIRIPFQRQTPIWFLGLWNASNKRIK